MEAAKLSRTSTNDQKKDKQANISSRTNIRSGNIERNPGHRETQPPIPEREGRKTLIMASLPSSSMQVSS